MSAAPFDPEPDPLSVTVRAPAKINLVLGVGAVREDGFHPLDTIYQAVSLYDDVTVTSSPEGDGWSVTTIEEGAHVDLSAVPDGDDNIAVRAAKLLAAHHDLPADQTARIEIRKGIPVAGGMAGGSADAAATLVAVDRLWNLQTTDDDLLALAAQLGSDVPFSLLGGTAHGAGRGELVTPVEDNGSWWWVAVFSDQGLSTPSVYGAFDIGEYAQPTLAVQPFVYDVLREPGTPSQLAMALRNDLEDPAFDLRKDLEATAEAIHVAGSEMAHLSGSGPTVLGICDSADHAREVAGRLTDAGHRVTVVHGPVAGAHVVSYG